MLEFSRRPSFKTAIAAGVSVLALALSVAQAQAQQAAAPSIGAVDVQAAPVVAKENAIGSKAAPGTAAALAPSQSNLNAVEPGSMISDKVIQDIASPAADYNEALKFTPNLVTTNTNGALGDTKSQWRGFADGQYNITFDGVPFGDYNDPTHHSNAYFPGAFLGSETIDRGPGQASQFGYATFGGTLALNSYDLSDKFGGSVSGSFGTWGTWTATTTLQSGLLDKDGTKFMFQYDHEQSNGAITDASVRSDYALFKIQHVFGDFTATALATYGLENYNNANAITMLQLNLYGKSYGQLNNNPATQQYVGYNNSVKQTDMEYLQVKGSEYGWNIDNRAYTYSYWYPTNQNNGNNQAFEGIPTVANGGIYNGTTVPATIGGSKVVFTGIGANDVIGYLKYNDYRAYGDMLNVSKDIKAGMASGELKAGMWWEYAFNNRFQGYYDYTNSTTFTALPTTVTGGPNNQTVINSAAYKLDLTSEIQNFQPYIEYKWKPTDQLTITPGFKYEYFNRLHSALINNTSQVPASIQANYTAALPYLDVRYRLFPELTIYGQASEGFLAPPVAAFYVTNFAANNIQPQRTTNFQAGAVYKNDKFSIDGDAYVITATHFGVQNTDPATQLTSYVDAGTAQYKGIEGEGTYVIQKGLSLYGAGAISSAKFIGGVYSGLGVGDAPDYTFSTGLIYDDQHWFGSLLYKMNGPMYGSGGQCGVAAKTAANCGTLISYSANRVGAYNETDLVVGYKTEEIAKYNTFFKKAEIRFGVNDLFDNRSVVEIAGDPTATGQSAVATAGAKPPTVVGGALTYSFQPGRYVYTQVKLDF